MGHGRQQTRRHVCTIHLQHFLPESAWENHFPPLSQQRPQKCEKMLLGNLACTMIMGFLKFWYSAPNPSFCLSPTSYWNVLSKYFGNVFRVLNMASSKRDRILISIFALVPHGAEQEQNNLKMHEIVLNISYINTLMLSSFCWIQSKCASYMQIIHT